MIKEVEKKKTAVDFLREKKDGGKKDEWVVGSS